MKTYRGSPAAARNYVEAGRSRADDYYLAEGTGVAERYVASPATGVRRLAPLSGDAYEAWVAGLDPDTGAPKGRLRHDENAVRFVEVVVNGPKSWSLAAELHPEISAAYDAAQDRAAEQIIAWLAQHATTRVGPRGAQVQVPVTELEAAMVRHHTSRAGDPHRHLHLQINARVLAEGRWRGLHTIGVRDSLDAINGIGHAAVMTDPGFRAALAAHGYTVDSSTGEVNQLAEFVGPFSARAAQIGRNIDRYEAEWRTANPACEPGPRLRQAWDARAWADARPDKVTPRDGAGLTQRWVAELHGLGFRPPTGPSALTATSVGAVDRDHAVDDVLGRLAARRSAWNAADIRGEVEQLIARYDVVVAAAIRCELAEDLAVRTLAQCLPLLDREGVPEHIRALTSLLVVKVEVDLTARLAARANAIAKPAVLVPDDAVAALDVAQRGAVRVLAGDAQLVVLEGAAGAGKTTTLAAVRTALERHGHRLVVVTPTRKAATVAARELDTPAFSAAWLAYQHGYRWDDIGVWTRVQPHDVDIAAQLHTGDLLLCDEAGMLDQDTARALLTIADEAGARVAFFGDRHQLPAVGRGGVLDLAVRWGDPDAHLTLDAVHRFARPDGEPDDEYAQLSLAMRAGTESGAVFDSLLARGQIRVHASEQRRMTGIAQTAATASGAVVVADTRDQVATLNASIRERRTRFGSVDDTHATTTLTGQRISLRDRVATRRNDTGLDVANRDTWTVTDVDSDGSLTIAGERGTRALPPDYVREYVELAYASTVHGVQGETVVTAHLVLGGHTTAAAAYVGMTRGRQANVAHLVAASVDDAREQWIATFTRDRADLGPSHAADLAAAEASRYARHRPVNVALHELHAAWTREADARNGLADLERQHARLVDVVALRTEHDRTVPPLQDAYQHARQGAAAASERAAQLERDASAHATQVAAALQRDWDHQLPAAAAAAWTVRDGAGRLGQRLAKVRHATEDLAQWSTRWQPYLPDMPTRSEDVVRYAAWQRDPSRVREALEHHACMVAENARPERRVAQSEADAATAQRDDAWRTLDKARRRFSLHLSYYGHLAHLEDPSAELADAEHRIAAVRRGLDSVRATISTLLAEPALRTLTPDAIAIQRDAWTIERDRASEQHRPLRAPETTPFAVSAYEPEPAIERSHGISR